MAPQVLLAGNDNYLGDMVQYFLIPGSFYLELVQQFLRDPKRDTCLQNVTVGAVLCFRSLTAVPQLFLEAMDDVELQYKIASQLGMSHFLHRHFEKHDYLQDIML